jgi:hypothetical protein
MKSEEVHATASHLFIRKLKPLLIPDYQKKVPGLMLRQGPSGNYLILPKEARLLF